MKLILAGVAFVASAQAGLYNARQCGQSCDVARRCTVGTYCEGGTCVGASCPSVVDDQAGGECGVYTCNSDQWCNAGIACSDKSMEGDHCYYADQCYTGFKCENGECRLDTGKYDTNTDVVEVTVTFPEELDEEGEMMVVNKFCEATAIATGVDQSFLSCSITKATGGLLRRLLMETYALTASTFDPVTAKAVQANSQAINDEVAVAIPQATVSALAVANLPVDPIPGSTPAPATDAPATMTPATSTPATNTPATNTPATSTPATATPATTPAPAPAPSGGSGSASDFTGCESCANAGFKWLAGIGDRGSCQSSDYTEGNCEAGKTNGDFQCITDAEKCCYGCTNVRGAYFFNGQSACQGKSTCTADIVGTECFSSRNDCAVSP